MSHPLVDHVGTIAAPIARSLALDLVNVSFQAHLNPPVIRVDIGRADADVALVDCEAMSLALADALDQADPWPGHYVLEISSPGLGNVLSSDRDFESFRSFPVTVTLSEEYKKYSRWEGTLQGRDESHILIIRKGRRIALPRELVLEVTLIETTPED